MTPSPSPPPPNQNNCGFPRGNTPQPVAGFYFLRALTVSVTTVLVTLHQNLQTQQGYVFPKIGRALEEEDPKVSLRPGRTDPASFASRTGRDVGPAAEMPGRSTCLAATSGIQDCLRDERLTISGPAPLAYVFLGPNLTPSREPSLYYLETM